MRDYCNDDEEWSDYDDDGHHKGNDNDGMVGDHHHDHQQCIITHHVINICGWIVLYWEVVLILAELMKGELSYR
jgi:hypothetical protein